MKKYNPECWTKMCALFLAITITLEAITVTVTLEAAEYNEGGLTNQNIPFDFTLTQDTLFNLSIQT